MQPPGRSPSALAVATPQHPFEVPSRRKNLSHRCGYVTITVQMIEKRVCLALLHFARYCALRAEGSGRTHHPDHPGGKPSLIVFASRPGPHHETKGRTYVQNSNCSKPYIPQTLEPGSNEPTAPRITEPLIYMPNEGAENGLPVSALGVRHHSWHNFCLHSSPHATGLPVERIWFDIEVFKFAIFHTR
jgi:hypothetical protein